MISLYIFAIIVFVLWIIKTVYFYYKPIIKENDNLLKEGITSNTTKLKTKTIVNRKLNNIRLNKMDDVTDEIVSSCDIDLDFDD